MAGEKSGTDTQEQGAPQGGQGGQQEASQQGATVRQAGAGGTGSGTDGTGDSSASNGTRDGVPDYAAQLAERDKEIVELKAQAAAAAESQKRAKEMSDKIEALEKRAEDDRITYQLTLAGARNVKAARALLADHGGDVDKLKEAEPWLFGPGVAKGGAGSTGLPNAGAATDSDKQLRHFYEVAGVADDKKD